MDIEPAVSELISILNMEIRSFSTVLELMMIEEKGLIECDNVLLLDALSRQEDVMSSFACLEKSRENLVSRISDMFGIDPGTLTITRLSNHVAEPQKRELRETAHVLTEIQKSLQQKKMTNALLIRQGSMMVESNLRYLMRKFGKRSFDPVTYNASAKQGSVTGSIGVDGRM